MAWQNTIENAVFSIKTGDGKIYRPLWLPKGKSKEFHVSMFDFINLDNTLVERKKSRSNKFSLVFYFQGENHIEESQDFETSAIDSRPWRVEHPYYGTLIGQPVSMSLDDSNLNLSEFSVEFWETINTEGVRKKISPIDAIKSKAVDFKIESSLAFDSKINPTPNDQSTFKQNTEVFSARYNSLLDNENYNSYQESLSKAMQSLDNIITYPAQAIQDLNTLINLPSEFAKSVEQRLNLAKEIFKDIKDVLGVENKANKAYFEAMGGAVITSLSQSATTLTEDEFYTRNQILTLTEEILSMHQEYLSILDDIQVSINDISNSFSASFENQNILSSLVMETVFNLYNLAFSAKQEREVFVQSTTNIIILTHKYIGLDSEDKNLERFRKINNLKNKQLFTIKKGKKIKYYV